MTLRDCMLTAPDNKWRRSFWCLNESVRKATEFTSIEVPLLNCERLMFYSRYVDEVGDPYLFSGDEIESDDWEIILGEDSE
jgi:hypothetical protein